MMSSVVDKNTWKTFLLASLICTFQSICATLCTRNLFQCKNIHIETFIKGTSPDVNQMLTVSALFCSRPSRNQITYKTRSHQQTERDERRFRRTSLVFSMFVKEQRVFKDEIIEDKQMKTWPHEWSDQLRVKSENKKAKFLIYFTEVESPNALAGLSGRADRFKAWVLESLSSALRSRSSSLCFIPSAH